MCHCREIHFVRPAARGYKAYAEVLIRLQGLPVVLPYRPTPCHAIPHHTIPGRAHESKRESIGFVCVVQVLVPLRAMHTSMFAMADACTSTFPSYGYHPSGFPSGSCVRWYLMSPATFLANKPTWGQGDLHKHINRRARARVIVLTYYGNSNVSTMVIHLAITKGHTSVYVRSVYPQHGERCSVHISRYVCPLFCGARSHHMRGDGCSRVGLELHRRHCDCAPQHFCTVSNVAAVWLALPLRRRSALHRIVLRRKTNH